MKHIVILCDGMADYPLEQLGGETPMSKAHKPNMNSLAEKGSVGLVRTVAEDLNPGSDVANLSVLGYDPKEYYSGRSPLEAASIGINLSDTDVTFRCNLVTLSDEPNYEDKTILDYCADDISSKEAHQIIDAVKKEFDNTDFSFYKGVSYRHCLVWKNGTANLGTLTPPHDITGKPIKEYIPNHPNAKPMLDMMKASCDVLKNHPINKQRVEQGKRPANAIWLWGEGKKKPLAPFKEKFGLDGAIISAVDLLKGIGKLAEMEVVEVEGVTGYIDTNFEGKAQAAIDVLRGGRDFVYVHIEAPDECGHRAETENKIKAIELIDEKIIAPIVQAMEQNKFDFKVAVLPDHATPISLRTHTSDPVPFLFYSSIREYSSGVLNFSEAQAKQTGILIQKGPELMEKFISY